MNRRGQGGADDPGGEWWDDPDDGVMRGWISPDDRLWRHPSEGSAHGAGPAPVGPAPGPAGNRRAVGPWIAGGATACAVLALAVTGLVMVVTGSSEPVTTSGRARIAAPTAEPTTEPGAGRMPESAAIADMVATAKPSVVALQVDTAGGTAGGTGIVTASGGIIVTASALVSGARSVTVVEPDGTRQPAAIVGTDQTSDLAVLRIADDLPAAAFDQTDPSTDSIGVVMALRAASRAGAPPSAKVYAGTVASAGHAIESDQPTSGFSDAVVEAPLGGDDVGCPLLNAQGQVAGMLEWTTRSDGATAAVFLPAEVVFGVTEQLLSSGEVDHGWFGAETSDAPQSDGTRVSATTLVASTDPTPPASPPDGARIDSVDEGSPAALAGLRAGDVIVAIDRFPIHSKAELETRLYPDAPETTVYLSVVRDGSELNVPVQLADSGSDGS